MAKFIRIVRAQERMEVLLNTDHISKIEVRYGLPSKADSGVLQGVSLQAASENPEAIRLYKFFIGGESYLVPGIPDNPVYQVIQDIYDNAIKTPEPDPNERSDD